MARRSRPPLPARPHLEIEQALWSQGVRRVAGIDEAGRGAWAGPVVAAAVVLPANHPHLLAALAGVDDSKKLTPATRERLYACVQEVAVAIGVGRAGPAEVDRRGLLPATRTAMERAAAALAIQPEYLIVDAVDLRATIDLPQQSMFFGDAISLSVAAASIVAKVSRDRMMVALDHRFPGYGFARHKGYGTRAHQTALALQGPSALHRYSFSPVRARVDGSQVED